MSNELMTFDQARIDLIKKTVANGATDDELKLFLHQCSRTGLDPLTRQIYFMKRAGKVTIQTSIDGFRVIAERSGDYGGQDEPIFGKDENGELYCKVTVYRFRGETRYAAAVGLAYWKEYCPQAGQDFMWKKMPHTMLSKVAEALALRKAYPQDLSGLYTNDEMDQAPAPEVKPPVDQVADEDRHVLRQLVYDTDLTAEEKDAAFTAIDLCSDYTQYQKIQHRLEARRQAFDTIPNPSQTDIKKHLHKTVKA